MQKNYEDFCTFLIKKKKISDNTLLSYKRDLKHFLEFLQLKTITDYNLVDINLINSYIKLMKKEGKSDSTISRNLSTLRCFFKYLVTKKVITFNPMIGVKNAKKGASSLPEILTASDVATLLSSPDPKTEKGIRDKAMLEVMYATGARVSELLSMKINDVNFEIGYVIINKSTSKERVVPLYPLAIECLNNYIKNVRASFQNKNEINDILFLNNNGSEMTRQGFWKIIKTYAKNCDIKQDITPKALRHSFATHLLKNGADIHLIKDMLGHTALSSTMVYAKILKNKYINIYENCHPRAKQV